MREYLGLGTLFEQPLVLFVVSIAVLWGSSLIAVAVRKRRLDEGEEADLNVVVGAALTLLALIIGFSFSMATARYDERKTLEEAEANAIGTEFVRAELLPGAAAARVKALLRTYTGERIAFYTTGEGPSLDKINADTAATQNALWAAVREPARAAPTPVNALVLAGMNDVLNSQGYTQAAWWNRIPRAAWALLLIIAVGANALVGWSWRAKHHWYVMLVMPVLASIAVILIADLDSPRGGFIRVAPQNLDAVAASLGSP